MNNEEKQVFCELILAASPFTSGDTVTETEGTEPLMDRLEDALEAAREMIGRRDLAACEQENPKGT